MELFGKKLLADTALTEDEHRRIGFRYPVDYIQLFKNDRTLGNEGMKTTIGCNLIL